MTKPERGTPTGKQSPELRIYNEDRKKVCSMKIPPRSSRLKYLFQPSGARAGASKNHVNHFWRGMPGIYFSMIKHFEQMRNPVSRGSGFVTRLSWAPSHPGSSLRAPLTPARDFSFPRDVTHVPELSSRSFARSETEICQKVFPETEITFECSGKLAKGNCRYRPRNHDCHYTPVCRNITRGW